MSRVRRRCLAVGAERKCEVMALTASWSDAAATAIFFRRPTLRLVDQVAVSACPYACVSRDELVCLWQQVLAQSNANNVILARSCFGQVGGP